MLKKPQFDCRCAPRHSQAHCPDIPGTQASRVLCRTAWQALRCGKRLVTERQQRGEEVEWAVLVATGERTLIGMVLRHCHRRREGGYAGTPGSESMPGELAV